MSELLDDIIALEDAAKRCIPRLMLDPVVRKCDYKSGAITLVDVEYHTVTGQKVVVLESCGPLSSYIAEILREFLAEEGIEARIAFKH